VARLGGISGHKCETGTKVTLHRMRKNSEVLDHRVIIVNKVFKHTLLQRQARGDRLHFLGTLQCPYEKYTTCIFWIGLVCPLVPKKSKLPENLVMGTIPNCGNDDKLRENRQAE
jgi:hypothetical protein